MTADVHRQESTDIDLEPYIRSVADFPKAGIDFKDITPLVADGRAFRASIDRFAAALGEVSFTKIAAFDARGFLFAAPLADRFGKPLVLIRKEGKLPRPVERESYHGEYGTEIIEVRAGAMAPGDSVVLVDDVIALGECMLSGCRLVESMGGQVAACLSLIRFTGLGAIERLSGYPVTALIEY